MDQRDPMAVWFELGRRIELPLHGLREVVALRETLERVERELVVAARANRSSWAEIGAALRVSRQSAYRRHAAAAGRASGDSPRALR
jgi:hypothetical protein